MLSLASKIIVFLGSLSFPKCSAEQHPGPGSESQVTPACSGWCCLQCCSGPGVCSLHPLQSPATDCAAGGDEDRRPGGQNRTEMINESTFTLETLKHFNIDVWFCTLCSHRPLCSSPGQEERRMDQNLHTFESESLEY